MNFGTADGRVTVTDNLLSGYAWSANDGWINLAPTNGGVKNGNGVLSGFAWDEAAGWVSFAGVPIDASGHFHGQATGGTVNGASYAINFDCANCSVVTSWHPIVYGSIITTAPLPPLMYSPIASSTVPTTSPSSTISAVSGKRTASAHSTDFGVATNARGFISNQSSLTPATPTLPTVSAPSAIHAAATTAKVIAASSFINFIRSVGQSIFAGISAIFHFLMRF